jgi:hypothetical protein
MSKRQKNFPNENFHPGTTFAGGGNLKFLWDLAFGVWNFAESHG